MYYLFFGIIFILLIIMLNIYIKELKLGEIKLILNNKKYIEWRNINWSIIIPNKINTNKLDLIIVLNWFNLKIRINWWSEYIKNYEKKIKVKLKENQHKYDFSFPFPDSSFSNITNELWKINALIIHSWIRVYNEKNIKIDFLI